MLMYPGKAVAKEVKKTKIGNDGPGKGKESRTWAMMDQALFFWTKPRVNTAEAGEAT